MQYIHSSTMKMEAGSMTCRKIVICMLTVMRTSNLPCPYERIIKWIYFSRLLNFFWALAYGPLHVYWIELNSFIKKEILFTYMYNLKNHRYSVRDVSIESGNYVRNIIKLCPTAKQACNVTCWLLIWLNIDFITRTVYHE